MPSQPPKTKPQTHVNSADNVDDLFQIQLTRAQMRTLTTLLPPGFSLDQMSLQPRKTGHPGRPSKKIFANNGIVVPAPVPAPLQIISPPPVKQPIIPKRPSPIETTMEKKHGLRDPGKRKLSSHLLDYEVTPLTSAKSFKVTSEAARKCYNFLQKLKKHPSAGPFLLPVDVEGLGLVDYYSIVHEPMDLSTVEAKLKAGSYATVNQCTTDVRKIWNNSFLYNAKGSAIHHMTVEMSIFFDKLMGDGEDVKINDTVRDLEKKVEELSKQITKLHQKSSTPAPHSGSMMRKSGNTTSRSAVSKTSKLKEKPLTAQEKAALSQNIKKLSAEHVRGVLEIVSNSLNLSSQGREEFVFDIETLPVHVARELERYVKNKISLSNRGRNKNKGKEPVALANNVPPTVKPHEIDIELHNGKAEDELTTQHHSVNGSEGKPEFKGEEPVQVPGSPSGSSESSFISDTDSEDEGERTKTKTNMRAQTLQKEQEIASFVAGGHGSMISSFVVK